ncbi:DUF4382 domain-containing protein [Carboxylicivirga linearis]|uniref:DUF4382 domain-containing protein n=1 Tax=Carboxylicivirga linearis TaxID=1628157 RepID=A0ABS5JUJ3_9BACT|nr:DUF4382 domain-containing protein [Carboxylicivirga linearis]MBS2098565.1 DUF4382 domain-containing protein [Carboxylicivirga linearis]
MKKLLILMMAVALFACEESRKDAKLQLFLTDAPSPYEEVLIDIQDVKINVSSEDDEGGWRSLDDINTGVYNLLDFTNGLDTLLGEYIMPAGRISQIRLVLGEDNQVKIDGDYYDLDTPSAQQSGLKLNVQVVLNEGITYKMWLDFDAGRSIVEKGNGGYALKPVIRTFTEATSGAIKGVVKPVEAKPYIMAISAVEDTFGTYADTITGNFLVRGLEAGSYKVVINPANEDYEKITVEDIAVELGLVTELDTVKFE